MVLFQIKEICKSLKLKEIKSCVNEKPNSKNKDQNQNIITKILRNPLNISKNYNDQIWTQQICTEKIKLTNRVKVTD